MSIETLLNEEIKAEIDFLSKAQIGTDEYKATVDGIAKLVDRSIELDRLNVEHEAKLKEMEFDHELKLEQAKEEKKDRKVKNGIAIAGIVLPLGVTIWGTLKSLKFEETGTLTTIMGRGFINKLLKK